MYHRIPYRDPAQKLVDVDALYIPAQTTAIIGTGDGAFISTGAHVPEARATGKFDFRYGCVKAGKGDHRFLQINGIPLRRIFADDDMMWDAIKEKADLLDVCAVNCTPTGQHHDVILRALEHGVGTVVTDKPLVDEGNVEAAADLVRAAQRFSHSRVWVTFQHPQNWACYKLREEVRKNPKNVVLARAGFKQRWLGKDPKCMQAWRARGKNCGPDDIGSHTQHLLGFVLDSPLAALDKAVLEERGAYAQEQHFWDYAAWNGVHANGIPMRGEIGQSLPGYGDDIFIFLELETGEQMGWRMKWGPETLLYAPAGKKVSIDCWDGWEPHMRGVSERFNFEGDPLLGKFGLSPEEHQYGWGYYWRGFYLTVHGDWLQRSNHPYAQYLAPTMQLDIATVKDGYDMVVFIRALNECFARKKRVMLKEFDVLANTTA